MGTKKGTASDKGKLRKKLTLNKETIKDLAPTGRRQQALKAGKIAVDPITVPRTVITVTCQKCW